MQNARFLFCKLQTLAARSAKKCKMQDAKIKNCNLQQQIRELIQKSAKCKLHARFFPLISFCKLQQIFGCKKFLISKYPPLVQPLAPESEGKRITQLEANCPGKRVYDRRTSFVYYYVATQVHGHILKGDNTQGREQRSLREIKTYEIWQEVNLNLADRR